jgi:hypothetical protein
MSGYAVDRRAGRVFAVMGPCGTDSATAGIADVAHDALNPVEVADDSVCAAHSPWLSEADPWVRPDITNGNGGVPGVVTDDRANSVDGQAVVSDIDRLDVHWFDVAQRAPPGW